MAEAFGRYMLLDRLAVGTVAELWRAHQPGDARIIAVKRLLRHVTEDNDFLLMFFDELHVARLLLHRNIAAVYDVGAEGDSRYLAIEYVSGLALSTVARAARNRLPLPLALAAFIAQQMAEALAYAHALTDSHGNPLLIVHRDVSPDNVLLSWSGDVKVTDFSIAKALNRSSGMMRPRLRYMSPEQIMGRPIDGRSDQFALGAVLYELCTGRGAFSAESEFAMLDKIRSGDVTRCTAVNPAIPAGLDGIIHRLLAPNPNDRFSSAGEASRALADESGLRRASAEELSAYLRASFPGEHERERALLASYAPPVTEPPEPTHEPLLEQMIAAFAQHKQGG